VFFFAICFSLLPYFLLITIVSLFYLHRKDAGNFGPQILDPQIGATRWVDVSPILGPQFGVMGCPILGPPIMDPHFGPIFWTHIMDPHYGPPFWTTLQNVFKQNINAKL
jgi:hypothetical protein